MVLVAACVAALVSLARAQSDNAFFAVMTDRTYAPGEKAYVSLQARGVEALEFRVYRVRNPETFFAKLDDLHQFGGRVPRPEHRVSLLEQFHNFKRRWWVRVRDFVRAQFTTDSRAEIRQRSGEQNRKPSTEYAQIPLLNPQQLVSRWKQELPNAKHFSWESQSVPVPLKDKGVYLVEATDGRLRAYTLLIVTDLAMIIKSAPGHVLAMVVERRSGKPAAGVEVLLRVKNQERARLTSDENGLVEQDVSMKTAPGGGDEEAEAATGPEGVLLLAHRGSDVAVNSPYAWYLSSDPERDLVGYIYTDRPVYRPGHTVQFKGILRRRTAAGYQLPPAHTVQVEITAADGKTVLNRQLPVSASGTVRGEYVVPANAALGYYSVQVHFGRAVATGEFHVEEYKKPEYEVRVTPEKPRLLEGEPIRATVEARYYFGEPVANAKVKYVLHRSIYWAFDYWPDEMEGEGDSEGGGEDEYAGEQTEEKEGQLDAEGKLVITLPTTLDQGHRYDYRYRVEARVTDAANREIAGHNSVLATYGSFYLTAQSDQFAYKPGERARLTIEAKDYDKNPVSTRVHLELKLVARGNAETPGVAWSGDVTTDAQGVAHAEVPLSAAGSWIVRATARTPENREVQRDTYLWVSGRTYDWAGMGERIQLIADKKAYQVGDTAKLMIVTGAPDAWVLVTTEGNGLHTRQVVHAGATATVEIPIRTEYQPNIFVGAAFIRDNRLHQGSRNLRVPAVERQLAIEITPAKEQFRPGEPAVYDVSVKDFQGKPVAADLSLGVVDEAIYAVQPELTPEIAGFFYGNVYNRVGTDSSLAYFFRGEAGKRAPVLAQNLQLTARGQIKPAPLVEPRVRKAFPDTAYWIADLKSDAGGHARVSFSFPDSLTTWRTTVRGATLDTRVGGAVNKVLVRKNLILRLAAPRFLRQGDEVTVSAIVHNYLAGAKTARVSLDAAGLELVEGSVRSVEVPSRGDAKLDWRFRAPAPGEVRLLGKALTDEESDALEITAPVVPYGVKQAIARAGSLSGAQPAQTQIDFPAAIEPASRTLEVSAAPSAAGAIFGALEFLTSYPYGCTEQTMSSFLPNVIVAQASKELGLKPALSPEELEKKVRAGLERLYDFQHPDGGWGWWKTDDSHTFMSAYVTAGLMQASAAGYNVRSDVINRARNWLREKLQRDSALLPDLRAYGVYALVVAGDTDTAALADSVWAERAQLSPYGAALLGLALVERHDGRAAELAADLERQAKTTDTEAWWPATRDPLLDFETDATPEATAHVTNFLSRARPDSPLLPKAAAWLVAHRDEGYWWTSTKQTAMVVYGLTQYLKRSGELKPNLTVRVLVNDRAVLTRQFTAASLGEPAATVRLAAADLGASNRVRVEVSGEGRVYWSARAEYYSTADKLVRTGSIALNLARDYFVLSPERSGEKIVYRLDPLSGPVSIGQVIAVRLTVSGGEWKYLLAEDPIPAGTEFIQRDDLYELKQQPAWWGWWFDRREFHDDRAALFLRYFRDQRQFVYLLKVVNPGRFRISPAMVQPMYQPQVISTSEGRILEVK